MKTPQTFNRVAVQRLDPESDKRPSQMTLSGFVTKISSKRPTSTVSCCETNSSERENTEPCDTYETSNFAVDVSRVVLSRDGESTNESDLRLNGTNCSTESLEVALNPPSKESQMNPGMCYNRYGINRTCHLTINSGAEGSYIMFQRTEKNLEKSWTLVLLIFAPGMS